MPHHRHRRNPARGSAGGLGTGTLLLLGGAAFVLLTPQGRALISGLGLGTGGGSIPSSLPVGTVRLANGQYRMPNGQIVGAPLTGQTAMVGSSITPIVGAVVQSLPSLVNLFRQLFPTTGGASVQIPATTGGAVPVEIPIGTLTLSDGSVLVGGLVLIGEGEPVRLKALLASEARKHERVGEWIERVGWERFFSLTGIPFTDKHIDDFDLATETFRSSTQFKWR